MSGADIPTSDGNYILGIGEMPQSVVKSSNGSIVSSTGYCLSRV